MSTARAGGPRRIVATGYGDESVLRTVPAPTRPPGPEDVVIRVLTIGVNPVDRKRYADREYSTRRGDRFPLALGVEAAGTVVAVGRDATGPAGPIRVGDEVIAYRIDGAYAEQVTVPASAVIPKPVDVSWDQAACLMLAGTTAAHALAAVAARPGQTILVHGVSGSVGRAVAQLARLDHVQVVGTTSGRNDDGVRRHGVTPIEYGPGLAERARQAAPSGYDAAIDLAGTDEAIDVSLEQVIDRQRIATVVAFDRAQRERIQAIGGSAGQDQRGITVRANARTRLAAFAQVGRFEVEVEDAFDFDNPQQAHELLGREGRAGHIILTTNTFRSQQPLPDGGLSR